MAALPLEHRMMSPERQKMHVHMRLCTSGSGSQPYVCVWCKFTAGGPVAFRLVR